MNISTKNGLRKKVLDLFMGRCIICGRNTSVLHEIEPKSKRPKDWDTPENQVPLCTTHHTQVHKDGALTWKDRLIELRRKRLANNK